jgi:hypothetical protein
MLASRAGGFMNNAVLMVDGGRNMVSTIYVCSSRQNAGINDGIRMSEDTFWPNNL